MDAITQNRREFHKFAETSWNEIRTSARIAEILETAGVQTILMGRDAVNVETLHSPIELSMQQRQQNMRRALQQGAKNAFVEKTDGYPGVAAIIDTEKSGPTIALRFDIDGLPYEEACFPDDRVVMENFRSVNPSCVHACGHDGHIAIGLELARRIRSHISNYRGIINLLFQPAEETILGAQSMVDKGLLSDVDYFLAVHLALSAERVPLPSHAIACGVCDFMSNHRLDVTFHPNIVSYDAAQGTHSTLLAACSAALNLHCIASHEKGLCRINVGQLKATSCPNSNIPNYTISLEYRGQFREISDYLQRRIVNILNGTAKTYGLTYTVIDHGEVPAGRSDFAMMDFVQAEATQIPWFKKIYYEGNLGGTDDAAVMMNYVQKNGGFGAYIGIGTDITAPLHNPRFDFDESCLPAAATLLERLIQRLGQS